MQNINSWSIHWHLWVTAPYDYTDLRAKEFNAKQQTNQMKNPDIRLKHILPDELEKGSHVAIATQGLKG